MRLALFFYLIIVTLFVLGFIYFPILTGCVLGFFVAIVFMMLYSAKDDPAIDDPEMNF